MIFFWTPFRRKGGSWPFAQIWQNCPIVIVSSELLNRFPVSLPAMWWRFVHRFSDVLRNCPVRVMGYSFLISLRTPSRNTAPWCTCFTSFWFASNFIYVCDLTICLSKLKTHEHPTFCHPVCAVDKHDPWQRLFFSHRFLPECRSRFVALALVPAGIGNTIRARWTKTIKLDTKLRPEGNNFFVYDWNPDGGIAMYRVATACKQNQIVHNMRHEWQLPCGGWWLVCANFA